MPVDRGVAGGASGSFLAHWEPPEGACGIGCRRRDRSRTQPEGRDRVRHPGPCGGGDRVRHPHRPRGATGCQIRTHPDIATPQPGSLRSMAGTTAWVLGDQLSLDNPVLEGADRVLLVQSTAALRARRFHRQKLHLVLVAMRHFADDLRERGTPVDFVTAESLADGLDQHRASARPDTVRLLKPHSAAGVRTLGRLTGVELVDGSLFLTDPADFAQWADGRQSLLMESFYRRQRRRLDLLMDGDEPAGGRWNFDADNREPPPGQGSLLDAIPSPYRPRESTHDRAVRRELDSLDLE